MSIVTLKYPAIFRKSKSASGMWNVSVPDVFGAVTCGRTYEEAVEMAKDLLRCIYAESPHQFLSPKSLEETQSNFPNELVKIIETEVIVKDDNYYKTPIPRSGAIHYFSFKNRIYEINGSLIDYRSSKIYLISKKGERIKEIVDSDLKYKMLQIFRSDLFQSAFTPELRLKSIKFSDNSKIIKNFKIDSEINIMDNTFSILSDRNGGDSYFCFKYNNNCYFCLDDTFDPDGIILKTYMMFELNKNYELSLTQKTNITNVIRKIYSTI